MASPKTRGRCARCGKDFLHAGMGKHLAGCVGAGPALHVAVDVGPGTWWMHLALAPSAALRDLDHFLRATWLECCGHLSAFEIGGTRFELHRGESDLYWGPKPRSMAAKASAILRTGMTFSHEYDFGSTTALRGRVLGTVAAGWAKVTLLARNEPISWPCAGCDAPASRVCPHCYAMACGACDAPLSARTLPFSITPDLRSLLCTPSGDPRVEAGARGGGTPSPGPGVCLPGSFES